MILRRTGPTLQVVSCWSKQFECVSKPPPAHSSRGPHDPSRNQLREHGCAEAKASREKDRGLLSCDLPQLMDEVSTAESQPPHPRWSAPRESNEMEGLAFGVLEFVHGE